MRFKINGEFETETLVDLAQRVMAELQDAGVAHVAGVNVYLSIRDARGVERTLMRDGQLVDCLVLDCTDLAVSRPAAPLELSRPSQDVRRTRSPKRQRRS